MNDTKFIILLCVGFAVLLMAVMLIGDCLAKTVRFNGIMIGFGISAFIAIIFGMAATRTSHQDIREIRKNKSLD